MRRGQPDFFCQCPHITTDSVRHTVDRQREGNGKILLSRQLIQQHAAATDQTEAIEHGHPRLMRRDGRGRLAEHLHRTLVWQRCGREEIDEDLGHQLVEAE